MGATKAMPIAVVAKPSPELPRARCSRNKGLPSPTSGYPKGQKVRRVRSVVVLAVVLVLALLPKGCNASLQIVAPVDRLLQKLPAYQPGPSPRVISAVAGLPAVQRRCGGLMCGVSSTWSGIMIHSEGDTQGHRSLRFEGSIQEASLPAS